MPTSTWYPVVDSYTSSASSSQNYGTIDTLPISREQSGEKVTVYQQEVYLRFHSAAVGNVLSVSAASLRLTTVSASSTQFTVYRLAGNVGWAENSLTHSNRLGLTDAASVAGTLTASSSNGLPVTYTLTPAAILPMLTTDWSGLHVVPASGDTTFGVSWGSKENTNGSTYWPLLSVTYETGMVPTITPVTGDGATFSSYSPSLQVSISDSDAGQTLTTTFQVSQDSTFAANVFTLQPATAATPQTNLARVVTPTLPSAGVWYWRAQVTDGTTPSAWTKTRSFTITGSTTQGHQLLL